jgi:hypothetical protein
MDKKKLAALYKEMSIAQVADHLGVARSTVYHYLVKFGIKIRSKSDAQRKHLADFPHQRLGNKHKEETKKQISASSKKFWESQGGKNQKDRLAKLRKKEWNNSSKKKRSNKISLMNQAKRPTPGSLSKFGLRFADYLRTHESRVDTCIPLTAKHVSDIVLEDRKIVIELVMPVSVYGEEAARKLSKTYERLCRELNKSGYRVAIVEDKSNSVSNARCERLYEKLVRFFGSKKQKITIKS